MATAAENQAVTRRFFDELCNARKFDVAYEIFTPDYQYIDPQVPATTGPDGMIAVVKVYQDGLEGHWRVDRVVGGENGMVTVLWTGQGKYTGNMPGMPIPPNSKAIEVSAISLIEVVDGKIKTQWCVWDTLGFMQQIGAVPSA